MQALVYVFARTHMQVRPGTVTRAPNALLEVIRISPLQLIRILFLLNRCPYEYGEFGRLDKWSNLAAASAVYVFVYPIGIPLFSKPLRA
jgi:hypothetical protein